MKKIEFSIDINTKPLASSLKTEKVFDVNFEEKSDSPIDTFFDNVKDFNILVPNIDTLDIKKDLKNKNFNLILLGQISIVESYLREIIRKLIIIDDISREKSSLQQLSYSAAINYSSDMLPEALMEQYSFASKKNILEGIKTFLDIKGTIPIELNQTLENFEKICQLRHCMIHRFGKLGSNNAFKLGMNTHSKCLEKPLSMEQDSLLETYKICSSFVLVINNFLFNEVLSRTVEIDGFWSGDLRKDKKKLEPYYELFISKKMLPSNGKTPSYKDIHNKLKEFKTSIHLKKKK